MYIDEDGQYFDPYYDSGDGAFSFLGEAFASTNWESVGPYVLLAALYLGVSIAGFFVFPPFMICLFATEGDVEECSWGVWANGYKDESSRCDNMTNDNAWTNYVLTDQEAVCYYENYRDDELSEGFYLTDLCDIKIEYDQFGVYEDRDYACYHDEAPVEPVTP